MDEARTKSWRYRALQATQCNRTQLGAMLIAILGHQPKSAPRFWTGGATINGDGIITSQLQGKDGRWNRVPLGHATEFATELNRLADTCKFDDVERLALFTEATKWIVKDHRATSYMG